MERINQLEKDAPHQADAGSSGEDVSGEDASSEGDGEDGTKGNGTSSTQLYVCCYKMCKYSSLLSDFSLPTLRSRSKQAKVITIYKLKFDAKFIPPLSYIFQLNYSLRSYSQINPIKCRTVSFSNSILYIHLPLIFGTFSLMALNLSRLYYYSFANLVHSSYISIILLCSFPLGSE